ncbi:hypothetical protein BDW69DRAFT_182088 [Aspergillus filifer]
MADPTRDGDGLKVRGLLQAPTIGASDPSGKGKQVSFVLSKSEASTTATAPNAGTKDHRFIVKLKDEWTFYEHKANGKTTKLWKFEWKQIGNYYYHDGEKLQAKAP